MPENDPQDSNDRLRSASVYLRQQFSLTDFLAIFVALPYVVVLAELVPFPLALGLAFAPVWFLMSGNWALIEGSTGTSACAQIRRGGIAANVLLVMAPCAVLAAMLSKGIQERGLTVLGIVFAVTALVHFRVRVKRFNERSRRPPNTSPERTREG
jgi:hypothetical protein